MGKLAGREWHLNQICLKNWLDRCALEDRLVRLNTNLHSSHSDYSEREKGRSAGRSEKDAKECPSEAFRSTVWILVWILVGTHWISFRSIHIRPNLFLPVTRHMPSPLSSDRNVPYSFGFLVFEQCLASRFYSSDSSPQIQGLLNSLTLQKLQLVYGSLIYGWSLTAFLRYVATRTHKKWYSNCFTIPLLGHDPAACLRRDSSCEFLEVLTMRFLPRGSSFCEFFASAKGL